MNTLTRLNECPIQFKNFINYKSLDFNDFKEYDYYRIVNPITKKVYKIINNKLKQYNEIFCYSITDTKSPCKYCVSANALENKVEKKKIEYIDNELFLVRVIPIIIDDKKLVLELFQNLSSSYFKTEKGYDKISEMINELNKLASLESFTNLYSHSFTNNKLKMFIEGKLEIETDTVTLAQLDINNLKYVNDTFGHVTGDELILKVAEILSPLKNIKNIFPGRTGGDEFQIILLNHTKEDADILLEPYLKKLNHIELDKFDYICSVSYGYLEWNKKDSTQDFINKVDKLMYYNKKLSKGLI